MLPTRPSSLDESVSVATTWHAAARRGDAAELRRLAAVDETLVGSRDAAGRSVLHHLAALQAGTPAASAAVSDALPFLLSRGGLGDLDAPNDAGLTALHRAVASDFWPFARALVEAGASPHARTARERRSPAEMARDDALRAELLALAAGPGAAARAARSVAAAPLLPGGAAPRPAPAAGAGARPSGPLEPCASGVASLLGGEFGQGGHGGGGGGADGAAAASDWPAGPGDGAGPPPAAARSGALLPPPPAPQLARPLALPSASDAAALSAAWTRAASALPRLERTPALLRLGWRGVPPSLRPAVWLAAVGANDLRAALALHGLSYGTLVALLCPPDDAAGGGAGDGRAGGLLSAADALQIDKDVGRSGLPLSHGAAAALRRLLRCVAATDPAVGYCQARAGAERGGDRTEV